MVKQNASEYIKELSEIEKEEMAFWLHIICVWKVSRHTVCIASSKRSYNDVQVKTKKQEQGEEDTAQPRAPCLSMGAALTMGKKNLFYLIACHIFTMEKDLWQTADGWIWSNSSKGSQVL